MSDLIDRQAAIEAIDKALSRTFTEPCGEKILKALPSLQSDFSELLVICDNCGRAIRINRTDAKPKTGKWIEDNTRMSGPYYVCDQCGSEYKTPDNFCGNCGAKMEEGE